MNKKALSESDICDKFIRPAMEQAGWDGMVQVYREFPLRAGRVVVRGRRARRDASTVLRADYALFFKPMNRKLVLERRDEVVAAKITEYLKATNRYDKTIVFCEDIEHAARMRQALT